MGASSTPQFLPFTSTGELLISKNKHIITLLNARDYSSPFYASCLSPHIHLEQHGVVLRGIDAFINAYRIPAEESPHEVEVEVKNSSAIVDEKTGHGTVVLHVTATGQKDDMKRAATVLSCWRRIDAEGGRWEFFSPCWVEPVEFVAEVLPNKLISSPQYMSALGISQGFTQLRAPKAGELDFNLPNEKGPGYIHGYFDERVASGSRAQKYHHINSGMAHPNTIDDRPEFAPSPVTTPPSHPVHRTHQIVHLLNARRYSDPFFNNLFTPTAHIEKHGIVLLPPTAETFLTEYKAKAAANPNIHAEITNSSAVVDEQSGLAQVVLHCAITGYSEGEVGKRAITLMCGWTKERGRKESHPEDQEMWKCSSYYMFYGIQEF